MRKKMVSDLVPHIGALADEICFLHSLTNKSNTHGPAEKRDEHRLSRSTAFPAWARG